MTTHWMFDRGDPRTLLAVCSLILVVMMLVAPFALRGDAQAPYIVLALIASVAQFIWALMKFRKWRTHPER